MQRIINQLPDFARPSHPVMRYVLLGGKHPSNRARILRVLIGLVLLAGLVIFGLQIATNFGKTPIDTASPLDRLFLILYWPLVAIQILMRLFALASTSGVIAGEIQRGTWDTLKVTTGGAILAMKTRWAAVFYRLRLLLFVVLLGRIVFVVIALINLTSFQGRYLDLLLSGTTPFGLPDVSKEASVLAGVLVTSTMMTAALLAPFTAIAFDASLGMLIGTMSQGRLIGILGQISLMLLRVFISALALHIGAVALSLTQPDAWPFQAMANSPVVAWIGAFFGIAEGDMGLTFLHLPHVQRLWADHEYGALVGVAFLLYVLIEAAVANQIVKWAGNRAAKADTV